MKIKDERSKNKCLFRSISPGTPFKGMIEGNKVFWMKINNPLKDTGPGKVDNAVNLETGELRIFHEETEIDLLNLSIVIKD